MCPKFKYENLYYKFLAETEIRKIYPWFHKNKFRQYHPNRYRLLVTNSFTCVETKPSIVHMGSRCFAENPMKIILKWFQWSILWIRAPRFSLVQQTKTEENIPDNHKMYQMALKCTKWLQNRPNDTKVPNVSISWLNKNIPKLGFLVWKYVYHLVILLWMSSRVIRLGEFSPKFAQMHDW
jgi:hypothetical protein